MNEVIEEPGWSEPDWEGILAAEEKDAQQAKELLDELHSMFSQALTHMADDLDPVEPGSRDRAAYIDYYSLNWARLTAEKLRRRIILLKES